MKGFYQLNLYQRSTGKNPTIFKSFDLKCEDDDIAIAKTKKFIEKNSNSPDALALLWQNNRIKLTNWRGSTLRVVMEIDQKEITAEETKEYRKIIRSKNK